eukprot:SAG31_NODE_77_length_27533_cov_47.448859_16_plen_102_part_00
MDNIIDSNNFKIRSLYFFYFIFLKKFFDDDSRARTQPHSSIIDRAAAVAWRCTVHGVGGGGGPIQRPPWPPLHRAGRADRQSQQSQQHSKQVGLLMTRLDC